MLDICRLFHNAVKLIHIKLERNYSKIKFFLSRRYLGGRGSEYKDKSMSNI